MYVIFIPDSQISPIAAAMSTLPPKWLRELCVERVKQQAALFKGEVFSSRELTARIWQILTANFTSGRVQRVIGVVELSEGERLIAYIDRVIGTFRGEHQRLERLAERDPQAWRDLYETLANRAYVLLSRLRPDLASATEAADFAQLACETIFTSQFPYDVAFDAWASRIVCNDIYQRVARSSDLLDRLSAVCSLDDDVDDSIEAFSLHDLLGYPASDRFELQEVQEWLVQAIAQLPSITQQQVIIGGYFLAYSEAELAEQLGKTPQSIYNLKNRALQGLRQILLRERFGG